MMKLAYPGQSKYFGCIGADEQGLSLKQIIDSEGVVSLMCENKAYPTGLCAAIVHNRERSLIANLGAALHFPSEHFLKHAKELEEAKIIYGTGFFLTSNKQALLKVAREARQR